MTSPVMLPPSAQPRRIPNLFHLLLFLALTVFSLLVAEAVLALSHPHQVIATLEDPRLQLYANIGCYLLAIASAALTFPMLWHRRFLDGIAWNARRAGWVYLPLGLGLGVLSQAISTLLPIPKKLPIEAMFETPGIIWILTLFGTLVAPLFEEIVFRGFLLPGIAIAIDYVRLPKSLEALVEWRSAEGYSKGALVASSIVTSVFFAGIHAPQLGFNVPAVALLIGVSLMLCAIRIRAGSVAASTLVHACYNFSVFFTLFIGTGGFRHLDKL